MRLNLISELKGMTIWISRQVPLFSFDHLDILCAWIGHQCEKLWPCEFLEIFRCLILSVSIYDAPKLDIRVKGYDYLNFLRGSIVEFPASWYIMSPNRTSVWEIRTILISRELPLFNFEGRGILCAWIGHPREKLWPFEFLESFRC